MKKNEKLFNQIKNLNNLSDLLYKHIKVEDLIIDQALTKAVHLFILLEMEVSYSKINAERNEDGFICDQVFDTILWGEDFSLVRDKLHSLKNDYLDQLSKKQKMDYLIDIL